MFQEYEPKQQSSNNKEVKNAFIMASVHRAHPERERGGNTLPYPTPSRFFLLPSLCAGEGLEHAKVAVILR